MHLAYERPAGRRRVVRHQAGVALAVVVGKHPPHGPVDSEAQECHRVVGKAAEYVAAQRVRHPVAVARRKQVAKRIDIQNFNTNQSENYINP